MSSRSASLLLPVCLCCASMPAWTQNSLTVPIELVHVNNPNLIPEGSGDESRRGSATLFRLHPQYTLDVASSASSRTQLTLGALIERSSNTDRSANRSLPSVGVLWENRSPTSVLGLRASVAESSTRETEFAEFGRVALDSTQRTSLVGATWGTELTSSTDLEFGVTHSRVTYDTPVARDYQETGGSVRYRKQLNEGSRYALTASTVSQRRDRDSSIVGGRDRVSRNALVLSYETDLSERVSLVTNVGVVRIGSSDGQTQSTGGFRLARENERLTYSFEWSVDVTSDGTERGYTRANTLGLSLSYLLTADTSLTAGASRARTLDAGGGEGALVYARVRSELTQFWAFTAGVEHRRARSAGAAFGRGHAVTVGLVYTHPDF